MPTVWSLSVRRLDSRVDESTGDVLPTDDSAFGNAVRTISWIGLKFIGDVSLPPNVDCSRAAPLKMAQFPASSLRDGAESVAAIARIGLEVYVLR